MLTQYSSGVFSDRAVKQRGEGLVARIDREQAIRYTQSKGVANREDAEDVVQNAIMRALKSYEKYYQEHGEIYDPKQPIRGWIRRCLDTARIDWLRRKRSRPEDPQDPDTLIGIIDRCSTPGVTYDSEVHAAHQASQRLETHEILTDNETSRLFNPISSPTPWEDETNAERIVEALNAVPYECRVVIEMRFFQDMKGVEIASALGIKLKEVKERQARAFELIQQEFAKHEK